MGLSGANKLCAQCIKECKQFKQMRVVVCPAFFSAQTGKPKRDEPCKGEKESGGLSTATLGQS